MASNPVNASRIAQALEVALKEDLRTSSAAIFRSETVNNDPGQADKGWIGIYRSDVKYNPRSLGRGGRNYEAAITLYIVCQMTSFDTGADAEERLEDLILAVLSVLLDNPSIRGQMGMLNAFDVTYSYNRTKETTAFFQEAVIRVEGLSST